jgi:protein-tyrosine phosphatase
LQAIQTQLIAAPNEPVTLPNYKLHITFICTYNVARSPMAEKLFRQQLQERGLGGVVRVTSAGTDAFQTGGMDTRAAVQLIEHGYPTKHEPAKLSMQNLNADLVIAMDSYNARKLLNLGVPLDRLRFLRNFDSTADFSTRDITNPCHDQDFQPTFQVIAAALPGLHGWVDHQLARRPNNGYC